MSRQISESGSRSLVTQGWEGHGAEAVGSNGVLLNEYWGLWGRKRKLQN